MQPPLSPSAASGSTPVLRLQLEGITKRYPTVVANDGIDLAVRAGEIHALLGENGAGKSTLMKIIYGAVRPDAGVVRVDGQRVHIRNPQQARHLGIAMVFQHFSLFDSLSVAENVWLGLDREPGLAEVTRRIRETATRYGLEVDPLRPVYTLSVGEMQRVEIIAPCCATRACSSWTSPPRCSHRRRWKNSLSCCASWPARAAALSISATNCTKFVLCAALAPWCGAGVSPACVTRARKAMPRCRAG